MSRLGRIPIKINSITVGSMALQDIKAVRKQPQTIDDLPDGSRNRTAGKPEYTFSLEGALDVDTQILFAAIEEAKATGEVKLTLGDIVEWSPLSSAAEAKVRQEAEAFVARQTLANAPELAVEYLFRFIAAANLPG